MEESDKDEQGAKWPPPQAACAMTMHYGGEADSHLNGLLVEIGRYLVEHGLFETYPIITPNKPLLCRAEELHPLNQYTSWYMDIWMKQDIAFYPDAVYDLRDRLDEIGISVKADSVAAWDEVQRKNVVSYLDAMAAGITVVPKPKELP